MRTQEELTDEFVSELLEQVVALEELVAARWPASMFVRWRLARDLRRSVACIEQGRSFTERRLATLATGWIRQAPAACGSNTASPSASPR